VSELLRSITSLSLLAALSYLPLIMCGRLTHFFIVAVVVSVSGMFDNDRTRFRDSGCGEGTLSYGRSVL